MAIVTGFDILEDYLIRNGYDGFCNEELECSCRIPNDLCRCMTLLESASNAGSITACVPGVLRNGDIVSMDDTDDRINEYED